MSKDEKSEKTKKSLPGSKWIGNEWIVAFGVELDWPDGFRLADVVQRSTGYPVPSACCLNGERW